MNDFLTPSNIAMAITGVVALVGFLKGWPWVREKIDIFFDMLAVKTGLNALSHVDEILVGFAIALYQSEIKILKHANGWNEETQQAMMDKLKELAKQHFGSALVMLLKTDHVDAALGARAEAAIKEAKARGARAKVDPTRASTSG